MAVELLIMQHARMTLAKSPPGTTVGGLDQPNECAKCLCCVSWLLGCLIGRLDGWLVEQLVEQWVGWVDGWLVHWLVGWSVDWLVGLVGWFGFVMCVASGDQVV